MGTGETHREKSNGQPLLMSVRRRARENSDTSSAAMRGSKIYTPSMIASIWERVLSCSSSPRNHLTHFSFFSTFFLLGLFAFVLFRFISFCFVSFRLPWCKRVLSSSSLCDKRKDLSHQADLHLVGHLRLLLDDDTTPSSLNVLPLFHSFNTFQTPKFRHLKLNQKEFSTKRLLA